MHIKNKKGEARSADPCMNCQNSRVSVSVSGFVFVALEHKK